MGLFYKEVITNKRTSASKAMFFIVFFTLSAYIAVNSTSYSAKYNIELELILLLDVILAVIALRIAYDIAYLSRIHYTYKLIDKELIFEKMLGTTRRMVFTVDLKSIEAIVNQREGKEYKDIERTYKFLCYPCKSRIYSCIVNRDGRKIRLYFQPSEELINKLKNMIKREP